MAAIKDGPKNNGGDAAKKKSETEAKTEKAPAKMRRKTYEKELESLQADLVSLQESVKQEGLKVCVIFEGRDAAGKGGAIKAIMERVSPRTFRVIALPAPSDREKSQMYIQRYLPHLPAAGEIVIFDRSWYNRAGVERVMGFCTEKQVERFLDIAPGIERAMVESGIILIKLWLEVSESEQTRRIKERMTDPRKVWKLTPMDLKSYSRWYDYARARDDMFQKTDTPWAPWFAVPSDDKRRARLNIIRHILDTVPHEKLKMKKVDLPKRQSKGNYRDPKYPVKIVPQHF